MRQTTSDLIDRAEAVMALRLEYPMMPLFKSLREEWAIKTEGFRKAEEVIMRLPSVDAPTTMAGVTDAIREAEYRGYMKAVEERPKWEWIPCSERLPNNDEEVIVSVEDDRADNIFKYTTTAWRYGDVWVSDNERICGIIAWMPLPKAYEETDHE